MVHDYASISNSPSIICFKPNKVDVAAKEKEKEVVFDEGSKYVTVFDPLDGSSNVDAGIPTGTILAFFIMTKLAIFQTFLRVKATLIPTRQIVW